MVEGARLESEYTSKAYRGFESLPLRQSIRTNFSPHRSTYFAKPWVCAVLQNRTVPWNGTERACACTVRVGVVAENAKLVRFWRDAAADVALKSGAGFAIFLQSDMNGSRGKNHGLPEDKIVRKPPFHQVCVRRKTGL